MPGVISRPKRSARGKLASTKLSSANISNYTRVSKPQSIGKETLDKAARLDTGRTSSIEIVLSSRKRKVDDDSESAPSCTSSASKKLRRESEAKVVEPITPVTRKKKTVSFAEPEVLKTTPIRATPTPSSNRKRQFQSEETEQIPNTVKHESSEPEVLFERLNLQSSPARKRTKTFDVQVKAESNFELPQELIDLLDLQVAFLKALSIQHAHNGANAPVDMRTVCPSIAQAWGKRKVTLGDIRRCVGVLNWTPFTSDKFPPQSPFYLSDYGRGKICIEFYPNAETGPLREQKLNMDFEANLRNLWFTGGDQTVQLFINSLPKAEVKASASAAKAATLLAKGQRTLEELKNGVVRKQQEKQAKVEAAPTLNPDGTKMSLLDRIRYKEIQQSQAAPGPSPAELQRQAALQRADDVAAVIGMLCLATSNGQARISFTITALMIKLKDSLRTPISQEDSACCIRLLATEVAPQWLRIVTIGGRENIVVQTAFQPSKAAVQDRVKALLG
jgi:DNA replication factor Cdt1 C-terminal domain